MTPINIAMVENERLALRSVTLLLESFPEFQVVGCAQSGEEFLAMASSLTFDVVLMDLMMPGGIDGLETIRRLREVAPQTRVVVVTASTDEAPVIGARRVGAMGYYRKGSDPESLLSAIRAVAAGRVYFDPAAPVALAPELLTPAEMAVVRCLPDADKIIADKLGLKDRTVCKHMANVRSKIGVSNRTELYIKLMQLGLIDRP